MLALITLPDDSIPRLPNLNLLDNESDNLLLLWNLRSNLGYLKHSTRKGAPTEPLFTPVLRIKGDTHSHGLPRTSNLSHNGNTLLSPTSTGSSYKLFKSAATNSLTSGTSPDESQILRDNGDECSPPNRLRFMSGSDFFNPTTNGLMRSTSPDKSQHPQMSLVDDNELALPNPPRPSLSRPLESSRVSFGSTANGADSIQPWHSQALRTCGDEHLYPKPCRPPHSTTSSDSCSDSYKSIASIWTSSTKHLEAQRFCIYYANIDKGESALHMPRPLSDPTSSKPSLGSFRYGAGNWTTRVNLFTKGTNSAESLSSSFQSATDHVPAHLSSSKTAPSPIHRSDSPEIRIFEAEAYTSESEWPHRSNSLFSHPEAEKLAPPASAVDDESLLTEAIDVAVNEATSLYESIRVDHVSSSTEIISNPFSLCSFEELERQYSVAVDAKNALSLRQMAILADIGLFLESLTAKIHLYTRDQVMLTSVYEDITLIRQECTRKKLRINFEYLEWYRSEKNRNGLGFINKKRHQTFSWKEKKMAFEEYRVPRAAALQFLRDPVALIESRLPRSKFQK